MQPDVSHAGGIWETRKIAAMAETYDVALAPHSPLGPITLAASLQVDACTPNAVFQEHSLGIHYNIGADLDTYLRDAGWMQPVDGYVTLPDGPGLGIEMDVERLREAAGVPDSWHDKVWRLADGSIAER